MRKLLAATAVLAMATTMAHADPGKGKGGGNNAHAAQAHGGGDKGPAMHANSGGKQDRGPSMKQNEHGPSMKQNDHGPSMKADRGQNRVAERGPPAKADNRGKGPAHAAAANKPAKVERNVDRKVDRREIVESERGVNRIRDERGVRRVDRIVRIDFDRNRGLIDGCPPGLAKKHNGCTPPGLLKPRDYDRYRYREAYYRPSWWGYDSLGSRVYYDDGYLYRLGNNNSILGYIPLLGGALSVGNVWPSSYQAMPVPNYYVDYYNLGPRGSYRYADNVLYRVDPETAAITSIAALLTGDNFAIGQPMPAGYDVYNVPYAYRDRYYDTPDAYYRYSDGYVYQVDPKTQLIAAAIQLLV